MRRDRNSAAADQSFRQHQPHARPQWARYAAHPGRRGHDPARGLRRLNMADRVILCIGTKKGLFVAESPKTRRRFALRGPFGAGVAVYSALIDTRGTPRIYGSSCNAYFGMKVLRSTDLGKPFRETKYAPASPKDD